MHNTPAGLEDLTAAIIGAAIEVHRVMGPGLLESIYTRCLAIELRARNLRVERQRRVPLTYRGESAEYLEVDLLVEGVVIVEVKAVSELAPIHKAQTLTYLKLTGCPAGLLINFNVKILTAGLRRLTHPDFYKKPPEPPPGQDAKPDVGTEAASRTSTN